MSSKACIKCKESKELTDFHRDAQNKDGFSNTCKLCKAAYQKGLSFNKRKGHKLRYEYDLSYEEYAAMLKKQNNRCAICKKKETVINASNKKVQKLCVDHNHKTGKVNGLLCTSCNKALGLFKDDPDLLFQAYTYLVEAGKEETPLA